VSALKGWETCGCDCYKQVADTARRRQGKAPANARLVFVPHPVFGNDTGTAPGYVAGKDPVAGKPVFQEIVDWAVEGLSVKTTETGFVEIKEPETDRA